MQFDQNPVNTLTPLPAKNIDTGLGLNRLASIVQGKPSVFETDQFWPLIELGEELSGRRYGQDYPTDRALRMLADHSRAMSVPDRRRRRPVERGSRLRAAPDHAPRDPAGPLARARPGLPVRLRRPRHRDHGIRVRRAPPAARLDPEVARVRGGGLRPDARAGPQAARRADRARAPDRRRGDRRRRRVPAPRHLRVPDRPDARARGRARPGGRRGGLRGPDGRAARAGEGRRRPHASSATSSASAPLALAGDAGFATDFVGYETTDSETTIGAAERDNGRVLVKLVESPFYATGGGQVADSGYVECLHGDCRARVEDVLRLGDDQVLAVVPERGHDRGRRARPRARRPRRPARDRVQPHRDSPAARRAPPAARNPRPAGRLLRRPRQAALRLHARQGADRRGARTTSRTR